MATLIGIDVGGTNLRVGIVEVASQPSQARLIEEVRFQADFSSMCRSQQYTSAQAWQKILATIASAIETVRKKYPQVSSVGIGFPGFIDPITQNVSQSPNLPGLTNVDLSTDLSKLIELPVLVENDALAAAYGEFASLGHLKNLIYLGLGTGVGGGLIINSRPFQGRHGVAMEVGHIIVEPAGRLCGCGNQGCMEKYASASGVAISYNEATGKELEASGIAKLAQQGDKIAIGAYDLAGKKLAQALAHILKVIDVTDIVIGGGMSAAWPLMQPAFNQQLTQDLIPALRGKVNVRISDMGDQAGIIGAAMLAQHKT